MIKQQQSPHPPHPTPIFDLKLFVLSGPKQFNHKQNRKIRQVHNNKQEIFTYEIKF